MKSINKFTHQKYASVNVTLTRTSVHQNHHSLSGRSTQSAVDFFNTLHLLAQEPIREQAVGMYEF